MADQPDKLNPDVEHAILRGRDFAHTAAREMHNAQEFDPHAVERAKGVRHARAGLRDCGPLGVARSADDGRPDPV